MVTSVLYKYMMKKMMIMLVVLVGMTGQVNANDYNKAVVGHVVQNIDKIDHKDLFEKEMARIAHQFALQMTSTMQEHLPYIIDGVMSELRQNLDSKYKCELLEDTKIADKECQ